MKRGILLFAAFVAALVFDSGCIFGPSRFKGVISYRHGRVYIRHDRFYRVGELSGDWQRMKTRARAISFYNPGVRSSIATDAFCGRSIGDRSLPSLGGEIISALEARSVDKEESFTLDGRGALRQSVSGTVDGVPVMVDLVVVRKGGCVFDMYSVAPPDAWQEVRKDFEEFFRGFSFDG